MMHIGIIREEKAKPDSRTPLTPEQCADLINQKGYRITVQSSEIRCYADEAYEKRGVPVESDISHCDILLGVKEVPIDKLIPGKTYFFFSHTIKKQEYNRGLLQAILEKNIRLVDYETLRDPHGHRLIAFGRHAGMVGAHNAIYTYGSRTETFTLPRMKDFEDYTAAKNHYTDVEFPQIKIVLTGHGRVGNGAATVLNDMNIKQVSPEDFLKEQYNIPVYTQLKTEDYVVSIDKNKQYNRADFRKDPGRYKSRFSPFYKVADIMINGIYWDNRAPKFFTIKDIRKPDFKIQVIADITCDIAPNSSIPTTIRASSIDDPIYSISRKTLEEVKVHSEDSIDVMAVDNLPNELPRDASHHFGNQFIMHVLPKLNNMDSSKTIQMATIAQSGELGEHYRYLSDFIAETIS